MVRVRFSNGRHPRRRGRSRPPSANRTARSASPTAQRAFRPFRDARRLARALSLLAVSNSRTGFPCQANIGGDGVGVGGARFGAGIYAFLSPRSVFASVDFRRIRPARPIGEGFSGRFGRLPIFVSSSLPPCPRVRSRRIEAISRDPQDKKSENRAHVRPNSPAALEEVPSHKRYNSRVRPRGLCFCSP